MMENGMGAVAFAAYVLDTLSQIIYSTNNGFILNVPRRGHG
jgi:hypothetical protein